MEVKELKISFLEYASESELPENDLTLLHKARDVAHKAYAPYSGFFVGAAAELENGEIVTGNNQENAAYPSGLCAERVAIFHANSVYPEFGVRTLVVTARNRNGRVLEPVTPCGACRQAILETEARYGKPIRIILDGQNKILVFEGIGSLLPFSFSPDSLLK